MSKGSGNTAHILSVLSPGSSSQLQTAILTPTPKAWHKEAFSTKGTKDSWH